MSEDDGVIDFVAWCAKADARREDDGPAANAVRRILTTFDELSERVIVETERQVRAGLISSSEGAMRLVWHPLIGLSDAVAIDTAAVFERASAMFDYSLTNLDRLAKIEPGGDISALTAELFAVRVIESLLRVDGLPALAEVRMVFEMAVAYVFEGERLVNEGERRSPRLTPGDFGRAFGETVEEVITHRLFCYVDLRPVLGFRDELEAVTAGEFDAWAGTSNVA